MQAEFFNDIGPTSETTETCASSQAFSAWLLTAGVPCQPASVAGKRQGAADDRWLWPETLTVVENGAYEWLLFENPNGITSLDDGVAFEQVCAGVEALNYEIQPFDIPACALGADHRRQRLWLVAHSASNRQQRHMREVATQTMDNGPSQALVAWDGTSGPFLDWPQLMAKSELCRVVNGVSSVVDIRPRLHAYGNSIVPQVAFQLIKRMIEAEEMIS